MKKIELNNVSVSYIVGDFSNRGLKDVIIQKIKGQSTEKKFVAVKNVSFSIEEGDLLGIVGTNGAGVTQSGGSETTNVGMSVMSLEISEELSVESAP